MSTISKPYTMTPKNDYLYHLYKKNKPLSTSEAQLLLCLVDICCRNKVIITEDGVKKWKDIE